MMEAIIALVFGLVIGSFLNVCIYRWPRDLSVVKPRSHCPGCEKTIAWYDNVPLLSYLLLKGRCRHCHARIPWRYPVVELATGILFFYFVYADGVTVLAAKMCVYSALLVGLIFTDMEERILPDEMTIGGVVLGLIFAWWVNIDDYSGTLLFFWLHLPDRYHALTEAAVGAAVPAFFLYAGGWAYERIRHKEGLGFGDVKLIAMIGAFLGLHGALLGLLAGSLAGSIIGYGYIKATNRDPSEYELPFGSFIGVAALVVGLWA
jgi:leader peptidase (prepilin peptidase)/N-methyltransferase